MAFYGPLPHPPTDPFAFYVWEVLGTKTTPGRRDTALNALRRIPAMTPESLRRVGRGRLETIVRQCGPFVDERLSALDAGIDVFRRQRDFTGRLKARLRLAWLSSRDLPHLGHAGALRLLLFAGPHTLVPVDQDIARLAVRLGLVPPHANLRRLTREVRRRLGGLLPKDSSGRRRAVQYLFHHAHTGCIETDPHCGVCPLRRECRWGNRGMGE